MTDPIRICFIIDSLSLGGTESQLLMLLRHLDRMKVEPFLVLLDGSDEESIAMKPDNCLVRQLGIKKIRSISALQKARDFRFFLKKKRIDIIQAYFPASTFFAALNGKICRVPLFFGARRNIGHWMNGFDELCANFLNRFFVDKIIANAEACKQSCIKQENVKSENVVVIPNGIETGKFSAVKPWRPNETKRSCRVGAVSNLKPVKGTDVFIEAAKMIVSKCPDFYFEIAGKGDFDYYRGLIERNGLTDRFVLPGSIGDIPSFLAELDIAVLPSRAEGLSNSLLEYMAAGRPCIATNVGGNGELIQNDRNGILVPPEDPQALADAILSLWSHPQKAASLAEAAQEDIRSKFDAQLIAQRYTEFCTTELNKKRDNQHGNHDSEYAR